MSDRGRGCVYGSEYIDYKGKASGGWQLVATLRYDTSSFGVQSRSTEREVGCWLIIGEWSCCVLLRPEVISAVFASSVCRLTTEVRKVSVATGKRGTGVILVHVVYYMANIISTSIENHCKKTMNNCWSYIMISTDYTRSYFIRVRCSTIYIQLRHFAARCFVYIAHSST